MSLLKDLVSYWSFDSGTYDTGTKVVDDLHGSNNGTANNSRVYGTDGKLNKGTDFTKGYDKITTPGSTDWNLGGQFTISCWLKTTQNLSAAGVITRTTVIEGDYKFIFPYITKNSTLVDLYVRTASGVSFARWLPDNLTNGDWYHLVGVYDKSEITKKLKIYVNGNEESSSNGYNEDVSTDTTGLTFGVWKEENLNFFNGLLDEVGIWSRALSAAEVKVLYNNSKGLAYPFSGRSIFFGGGL
jgi:hypothetical protein